MKLNNNFDNIPESYLFATIGKKVNEYKKANSKADVIRLGIGDVTLPLCEAVVTDMSKAVREMGTPEGFRGYGPETNCYSYDFLTEALKKYYAKKNVSLEDNEIFVSDGAKSDLGSIMDLLDTDNTILLPDPVYPAYLDVNVIAGHKVIFSNANYENGFVPMPDKNVKADVIYICSPNNPTGAVYGFDALKAWVDYALAQKALIIFDAAYEAFVDDPALPTSIYQIEGAKKCALEICSLSKTAGFTGTRCGYTIVPNELVFDGVSVNKRWQRRQTTKYNGTSYIIQRGAAAVFSDAGFRQTREQIAYYKNNAAVIGAALDELGIWYCGGKNSPYIWLKCPNNMKSWDFFDLLLQKAQVVGTPGAGFGKNGEGFFRLTAFGNAERTREAVERLKKILK